MFVACGTEEELNSVNWSTNRVSLEAEDFFIIADEDTFYADVSNVDVHSDPGDSAYCSLEVTWQEKGVEMRLYIYFHADGQYWWSDEFRTYNGQSGPHVDWIYYYGTFFRSPLGTAFTGDFEKESSDTGNQYQGKLHFQDLNLQAFLNQ